MMFSDSSHIMITAKHNHHHLNTILSDTTQL